MTDNDKATLERLLGWFGKPKRERDGSYVWALGIKRQAAWWGRVQKAKLLPGVTIRDWTGQNRLGQRLDTKVVFKPH